MYEIFAKLMQEKGLTSHYQVYKATGVSQSSLNEWKSGKSVPGVKNMSKLAEYFGVTVEYLLGKEKEKPHVMNDEELSVLIENKVKESLNALVWNDEQAKENIELFSSLSLERKQEALRYLRYLASVKDK